MSFKMGEHKPWKTLEHALVLMLLDLPIKTQISGVEQRIGLNQETGEQFNEMTFTLSFFSQEKPKLSDMREIVESLLAKIKFEHFNYTLKFMTVLLAAYSQLISSKEYCADIRCRAVVIKHLNLTQEN